VANLKILYQTEWLYSTEWDERMIMYHKIEIMADEVVVIYYSIGKNHAEIDNALADVRTGHITNTKQEDTESLRLVNNSHGLKKNSTKLQLWRKSNSTYNRYYETARL
jgi:hypothetical protein